VIYWRGPWRPRGKRSLRRRNVLAFALGGLMVSVVIVVCTYVTARGYLIRQRENSAVRQAYADASYVREGLLASGVSVSEVLQTIAPPAGTQVLVHRRENWFSSGLDVGRSDLPEGVLDAVYRGRPVISWTKSPDGPALVVGVPLPAANAQFYERSHVGDLSGTLDTLKRVLMGVAAGTAAATALLGRSVAGRVMRPLDDVAMATSAIAAGCLDTRLSPTEDPDLVAIVACFNDMADSLQARIEREARFTADVSHELRSPLTTLVTGVELLDRRRQDLPERSRQALDLVVAELARFQQILQDLLELARLDAGASEPREIVDLRDLVGHTLQGSGRPRELLRAAGPGEPAPIISASKRQLERALSNLLDNGDRHGGGIREVRVSVRQDSAFVEIDDDGQGVPPEDRERIFARFARAEGPRGSTGGTGLGLSLVAETLRAHSGAVWCTEAPGSGARFVLRVPLVHQEETAVGGESIAKGTDDSEIVDLTTGSVSSTGTGEK
jgi:two-component system, OmpR family, sensor histidine kinase MtrB